MKTFGTSANNNTAQVFLFFLFFLCQNEWSQRSKRRAQMPKVRLFPAVSFPYYPSPVSGQPGSNYCTLMAGPITSRLIVWSLPYVQAAVMLIHLFTQTHKVRRTALGTVQTRGRSVSRWAWRSNGSKTWKLSQRQMGFKNILKQIGKKFKMYENTTVSLNPVPNFNPDPQTLGLWYWVTFPNEMEHPFKTNLHLK